MTLTCRSLLFAPGHDASRLHAAFASEADAVVADLEVDAVVVPKATPEIIAALGPSGPPIVAVVETAVGLRLAFETATSVLRVSRQTSPSHARSASAARARFIRATSG